MNSIHVFNCNNCLFIVNPFMLIFSVCFDYTFARLHFFPNGNYAIHRLPLPQIMHYYQIISLHNPSSFLTTNVQWHWFIIHNSGFINWLSLYILCNITLEMSLILELIFISGMRTKYIWILNRYTILGCLYAFGIDYSEQIGNWLWCDVSSSGENYSKVHSRTENWN